MGRLYSKYMEYDRRLKEQFINDLDYENIVEEIIRELTALKGTSEVSSRQNINVGPKTGGTEGTNTGS